jgi:serine/threonine protein kinase
MQVQVVQVLRNLEVEDENEQNDFVTLFIRGRDANVQSTRGTVKICERGEEKFAIKRLGTAKSSDDFKSALTTLYLRDTNVVPELKHWFEDKRDEKVYFIYKYAGEPYAHERGDKDTVANILKAFQEISNRSISHGDIKEGNVLTIERNVCIIDFEKRAKCADRADASTLNGLALATILSPTGVDMDSLRAGKFDEVITKIETHAK